MKIVLQPATAAGFCRIAASAALAAIAAAAGPARAERVACALSAPCGAVACTGATVAVSFEIDRAQFAPPYDPDEPPRNKVTRVEMGGQRFAAEPFLIGGMRGFWEDAGALGERMLTVGPDGAARYSELPSGNRLTGTCEVFD